MEVLKNLFRRFGSEFRGLGLLLLHSSPMYVARKNENADESDYGDYFCSRIISNHHNSPEYLYSVYKNFIQSHKARFIVVLDDIDSIIDSRKIITPLHDISPTIEWIVEQPGRQRTELIGSFHQVHSNFYASAYDPHWKPQGMVDSILPLDDEFRRGRSEESETESDSEEEEEVKIMFQ